MAAPETILKTRIDAQPVRLVEQYRGWYVVRHAGGFQGAVNKQYFETKTATYPTLQQVRKAVDAFEAKVRGFERA